MLADVLSEGKPTRDAYLDLQSLVGGVVLLSPRELKRCVCEGRRGSRHGAAVVEKWVTESPS